MISFNHSDYHLKQISTESKLFNLAVDNSYRVYGLKQEDNPLILLEYPESQISPLILRRLKRFFRANSIEVEAIINNTAEKIYIGLRYDLRHHIVLSSAILQTIIYACEERLDLSKSFAVPGIPKFAGKA